MSVYNDFLVQLRLRAPDYLVLLLYVKIDFWILFIHDASHFLSYKYIMNIYKSLRTYAQEKETHRRGEVIT